MFYVQKGLYTYKHVFELCEVITNLRKKLCNDVNKVNVNKIIDNTLIQTGTNDKEETLENKKICKLVMIYVLDTVEKIDGYITDGQSS